MLGMLQTYGGNFTLREWDTEARAATWRALKGGPCLAHQTERASAAAFGSIWARSGFKS